MKSAKVLIGGRYTYNPSQPLRESASYSEYRSYDKVTKRDLMLHKLSNEDPYIDRIRDIKHAFVHSVFDVVRVEEESKLMVFFEPGPQAALEDVLARNHYLLENDALVVFKFLLLALKELHEKLITYERMCPQNVLFCTHSLIKLGTFAYPTQVPLQTKSPEVLREERPNYASDIYSLGTVLYYMLNGCYPFDGESEEELLGQIKGKKFKEIETSSPLRILVSKEVKVLLASMLDFYPQNRPSLESILKVGFLSFPLQTDIQLYLKPKGNIIPQPFLRKYLVFRASKILYRIDDYYEESCYLALNIKEKQFVHLYVPDVKMFEADPRRIESYYEKLRALKESYLPENCGFVCKIDDYERFRREPVLAIEYCNQGDLFHYLQKLQKQGESLNEKQVNILMYLLAIAYKQIRDLGVTSIHTVHSQRIMIKNKNIKIREPGLLTPFIESKLMASTKIDYFAPQLKEKSDFVELDKSDMWSYGVLYYFLLRGSLPEQNPQTKKINIDILQTNRKNKNLIGKCLDQNVTKRLTLEQIKIEGVNESMLESMLEEKRKIDQAEEQANENQSDQEIEGKMNKDNRVIFKSRKKRWCKNYNQVIAKSTTTPCRLALRIIFGLVVLWVVFFGLFFVNGGIGLLRTNYYRKITLQVPYNYATSLYNLTILSTNGTKFANEYKDYSYEQFTIDLNCTENNHSSIATGQVHDYINYSHSVQCFFGFVFAIFVSVCYAVVQVKLDLPKMLVQRKEKGNNMGLFHHIIMQFVICAMLFCFFTIFVFEYVIQMSPCLGVVNQAYPKFTAMETLLNGNVGSFFQYVFPTVILWSILMILYVFLSLFHKKINARIMEYKFLIPAIVIMFVYTLICRIGFGSPIPLEPTWSYKINKDITSQYWGLFGLFPQLLILPLICFDRLLDFIFWFFLRLGMEPNQEEDIKEVEFNAKLEPIEGGKNLDSSKANINMLHNDFEIFD